MADEFALLRNDLELTVKELSDSYEELSLLHRVSETLSGLDADEICRKIIDEALSSVDAQTAAVMLLDETLEELVTHTYRGKWRSSFVVKKVNSAFWDAIEKEKSIGICNIKKHNISKMLPDIKSILICPMIGKKRVIGVLVVADKYNSEEFFSNDIKLINAIARHAALFMENAVLSKEMESFLLGTIRAFVKALEATSYWTAGHTERVTEYAIGIGKEMGLDPESIERLKISGLLHDIGKLATPKEILNKKGCLSEEEWLEIRRHPGVGADILEGLEKFSDVIECIKFHHEHYDGNGSIHGLKGNAIPLPARILAVADAFDAMTSDRPYREKKGIHEAVNEIIRMSGQQFDPEVVRVFKQWVERRNS